MKLLSWMHRKLQKDATGSSQASVVGSSSNCLFLNPSANNQGGYVIPSNDTNKTWEPNQQCLDHLQELNGENTNDYNETQSTEIFPGFLTIGTLCVEPISEPPTPTLDLPSQVINESVMAEMKLDLKLINEELEKFLKFEAEKEGNIDSSRKNSHASTITLSDEVKEDVIDHNFVIKQVYPLQGYLLGSSTELQKTKPKAKKEKLSLCQLFKKSTTVDISSTKEAERIQKQTNKKPKSSNFISKILHPTQISPSLYNHCTSHATESSPTPRKLNKIKQFFHKKVHPEISKDASAAKEHNYNKYSKKKKKKKNLNSSNSYVDSLFTNGQSGTSCWGTCKKEKNYCSNADISQPRDVIKKNNLELPLKDTSDGVSREHWIKSDEYFVLELQHNKGV